MPIVDLLKSYGWMEIQDLGFQRGTWKPMPTCRGATTIDFVFVSPEMIPFYKRTCSWPWFADHVILGAESNQNLSKAGHNQPAFLGTKYTGMHGELSGRRYSRHEHG
jgi:hypothetical protein